MQKKSLKKGDLVELQIEDLAFGGLGLAKIETPSGGKIAVFVPYTLPGDKVLAQVKVKKKSFIQAEKIKLLSESENRITPKCRHFEKCGGCKLQFLSYTDQLLYKKKQVSDLIERIGGFPNFQIAEIIPCAQEFFYRNKMEFSFSWNQRPSAENAHELELNLGLHPPGKFIEVENLQECFLQSEATYPLLDAIRRAFRKRNLTAYHVKQMRGFLRSITLRESKFSGDLMLIVSVNGLESDPNFCEFLQSFALEINEFLRAQKLPNTLKSLYLEEVFIEKGSRTRCEMQLCFGDKFLHEKIALSGKSIEKKALEFAIAPEAFFQPNTHQAGILYGQIFELLKLDRDSVVFDLFCGTGTIAMFCALKAGKVFGVELNAAAVESAISNAKLNSITNVEFLVGDVFEVIKNFDQKPSVVIVDPPRAGVGEKALQKIIEFAPMEIVYISCNPATLARDLKFLAENAYQLLQVKAVDMFPQTAHIECVAHLRKK